MLPNILGWERVVYEYQMFIENLPQCTDLVILHKPAHIDRKQADCHYFMYRGDIFGHLQIRQWQKKKTTKATNHFTTQCCYSCAAHSNQTPLCACNKTMKTNL